MKKTLTLFMIFLVVTSCLVIASAQPRKRRSIIGGAGGAGSLARRNKAEPGDTITVRRGRGRYVTRNGKRIWVPQGSPSVGVRRRKTNRP